VQIGLPDHRAVGIVGGGEGIVQRYIPHQGYKNGAHQIDDAAADWPYHQVHVRPRGQPLQPEHGDHHHQAEQRRAEQQDHERRLLGSAVDGIHRLDAVCRRQILQALHDKAREREEHACRQAASQGGDELGA